MSNLYVMESKKIESIFVDYLNKENTNYALLISGKWGSGKTYLWKNVLEKSAIEKELKPIYVSLNGINKAREIEGILFSKVMFADKLDNPIIKNSLKFFRNGANILGGIFAGGSKIDDLTNGMKLNLDLSSIVLCFDDLERCSMPLKEILGLINDYTEHKNIKVVLCADEDEIKYKEYNKIKEKVIGRVLKYTANYDELLEGYITGNSDKKFSEFLNKNRNVIISFFKKHDVQNLRTFGFYLENLNLLYKYYIEEKEQTVSGMLFFTAIICNEFKRGKLTVSDLKDRKIIDNFILYVNPRDINNAVDRMIGVPVAKTKNPKKKKKTYNEKFIDKYLSSQNDKDKYLFSEAIYEFILSGYLDAEKLKNEIDYRNGKGVNTEEDEAYNSFNSYNFRILENEELDKYISKVLKFSEQGRYNMYSYQIIYYNLLYQIEIGSFEIEKEELINHLIKGLDVSKDISDFDVRLMRKVERYKTATEFNKIEKKIFEIHNEKGIDNKKTKANEIFKVISEDFIDIDDFFSSVLNSDNTIFEFIDSNEFFNALINLKNKKLLIFSNALIDSYKVQFLKSPEKVLPFFTKLHGLILGYLNDNNLKNPKKIILEELSDRINEIITKIENKE